MSDSSQYLESLVSPSRRSTPVAVGTRAARKRKRLQEAVARLASGSHVSPVTNKRRSSVSDAGLLSVSGSFLDCTTSPATHISDGKFIQQINWEYTLKHDKARVLKLSCAGVEFYFVSFRNV